MTAVGISVVICCHNSATELPQTLQHLLNQQVHPNTPWEVLIIDNVSRDTTSQVAQSCWPADGIAPLRVIYEPKLGLINARYRALAEAKYEILSFIDDDNWVCSNWVQTASEVMSQHPEVGACGSHNIPAFDGEKPWWFELSPRSYAVGTQGPEQGGDITHSRGRLVGAGLTIRKTAWQKLVDEGFSSLLVGCKGKSLSRGEDTELSFALVLAGWRLWYEPQLKLQHHLQPERLQWSYLRRLARNGGKATLGFDPYRFILSETDSGSHISFWWSVAGKSQREHIRKTWYFQSFSVLRELFRKPSKLAESLFSTMEGDRESLKIELKIGRLLEFLRQRSAYDMSIEKVQQGAWRHERTNAESAVVESVN